MSEPTVEALRILARDIQSDDGVANQCIADAADMLEVFFDLMQAAAPAKNDRAHFRFRAGGPMRFCVGHSKEAAIRAVMAEVRKSCGKPTKGDQ